MVEPMYKEGGSKNSKVKEVFFLFLWMGFTAFGGPAAHTAIFYDQVVRRRKWVDDQRFLDLLGATQLIPGPNSTEMCTHLGLLRAGWAGFALGGIGFILPSMLMVMGLAYVYTLYGSAPQIAYVLYAVKPVVIAIILSALWSLSKKAIKDVGTGLLAAAVIALNILGVDNVFLLLGGGVVFAVAKWLLEHKDLKNLSFSFLPATFLTISKATVSEFNFSTLFFSFLKIGSVLYGGGYVLFAFLRSEFVERLGWLSDQQIIDAIAIGQVTPGPISTAATFLGFILGGIRGALLATLGMFLPSFILVAATNPLIPRMRASPWFSAFLDGVNASSLALMAVVVWQLAAAAFVDLPAVAIGLVSTALVIFTRINTTWIIFAAVMFGVVRFFLGF